MRLSLVHFSTSIVVDVLFLIDTKLLVWIDRDNHLTCWKRGEGGREGGREREREREREV